MFKLTGWLIEDVDGGEDGKALLVINNSILHVVIPPSVLIDYAGYKVRVDAGVYDKELIINTIFVSDRNEDRRCPLSGRVVSIARDCYTIKLDREYGGGCILCYMYDKSLKLKHNEKVMLKGFLYEKENIYFVAKEKL